MTNYIGSQPTSVPLTSSDITDGIITTAKIADDAVTGAKIENSPTIANGLTLADGDISLASGHGISFASTSDGGTTTTSELLDDYEEGTWTPQIREGGSVMSGQNLNLGDGATYVRIGNLCQIQFDITMTAIGSGNGSASMYGLPFTQINSGGRGQVCVAFFDLLQASITFIGGDINPNATYFDFATIGSAGTGVDRLGATSLFKNNSRIMGTATYRIA